MLMAVPAAYALARLRFRGKKFAGFYVLATQMLPPVGIIIPYFLILRNIGWIDTYQGIILIYLSFSLPFAIWLLVSYFEDIPFEMEEAAYLDGASRLRTLWRIIIPQVRGGIAVTIVFVFLNAWNEFLFAVVLSGNTVRPVTVAMFNFVSVEQTLWAKLAAVSVLAMLPVVDPRHRRAEEYRQGPHRRRGQGRRTPMSGRGQVRFEDIVKMHGEFAALKGVDVRDRARRVLCAARPLRLRQEHDLAHPRRPRRADRGPGFHRRPGHHGGGRARPRHRHGVPELRALSAHDGVREHRLPARDGEAAEGRDRPGGAGGRAKSRDRASARPQARAIVRRPAAALRAGPRHRPQGAAVPARRAALQSRRQAAAGNPHRAEEAAALARRHRGLCHPRPGRSDDAGRPHGGVHGRRDPADRPARRRVRAAELDRCRRPSSAARR